MNKIIVKHTGVDGREPKNLALGEIAINTADGVLFFKAPSGELHKIHAVPSEVAPNFLDQFNRYLFFFLLIHWLVATVIIFWGAVT